MRLMLNGVEVSTMEELRDNFNESDITEAFVNGSLERWLLYKGYKNTADKIRRLKDTKGYSFEKVYDIFIPVHPLISEIREDLNREFCDEFFLPHTYSLFKYDYLSRCEAEYARRELAKKVYCDAAKFFHPEHPECISEYAAGFYGKVISELFDKWYDELERMAEKNGMLHLFLELKQMAKESESHLKRIFNNDLSDNKEFYSVISSDRLVEKMKIKEYDYRTESGILRLLEGLAPGKFEYVIENFRETVHEMQTIVDRLAREFRRTAHSRYRKYAYKTEEYVKNILNGV